MIAQIQGALTPQEYLDLERRAETKHEYIDGEVVAMAGASENHNLISLNIAASLHGQLRQKPCRVYQSDLRVQVSEGGLYTYPDVVVVCGNPQFLERELDTLLNPTLVIEVVSPSTASYDRGEKFRRYRQLPSIQEYLLVAQDWVSLEHYQRQGDHQWLLMDIQTLETVIELPSIHCQLSLQDVYEKVELAR